MADVRINSTDLAFHTYSGVSCGRAGHWSFDELEGGLSGPDGRVRDPRQASEEAQSGPIAAFAATEKEKVLWS